MAGNESVEGGEVEEATEAADEQKEASLFHFVLFIILCGLVICDVKYID